MAKSTQLCACGCGEFTNLSQKGKPRLWLLAHNRRVEVPFPDPNPSGKCQCGCGRTTRVALKTQQSAGIYTGHHFRFVANHHKRRGGLTFSGGRWQVRTVTGARVMYARVVMEAHLRRHLLATEVVHHINGKPDDDRLENLMLFDTHGDHLRYEWNASKTRVAPVRMHQMLKHIAAHTQAADMASIRDVLETGGYL